MLAQQTCLDIVLLYRPSTPTDVAARDLALAHARHNLVARLVDVGDTATAEALRASEQYEVISIGLWHCLSGRVLDAAEPDTGRRNRAEYTD